MCPEALECKGVWLRRNWSSAKEFLPLWHAALELVWEPEKLFGALLLPCRGHLSPPCTQGSFPISFVPPSHQ